MAKEAESGVTPRTGRDPRVLLAEYRLTQPSGKHWKYLVKLRILTFYRNARKTQHLVHIIMVAHEAEQGMGLRWCEMTQSWCGLDSREWWKGTIRRRGDLANNCAPALSVAEALTQLLPRGNANPASQSFGFSMRSQESRFYVKFHCFFQY